jgi:segregation and condensation protein B
MTSEDQQTPEIPGTTSFEGAIPRHFRPAVEAMLFAAERALTVDEIAEYLGRVDELEVPHAWVDWVLEQIQETFRSSDHGFQLVKAGDAWEFRSRGAFSDYVLVMYKRKPVRLSRPALEVLAIVAYRQPCTRADVDDIRGVDSSGVLRQLLERELLRIVGKSDDVGRPLIYGTSQKFLSFFGLTSLSDLPTLKEFTELTDDHLVKLQELEATLQANRQAQPSLPGMDSAPEPEQITGPDERPAQNATDDAATHEEEE